MLYVTVAGVLFCLTLKGYSGKKLSCFVRGTEDTYLFNFLRMLFCIFIGIALVFIEGSHTYLILEPGMLAICALAGFSNAAFLICWMLAIRKNSMVSVDVGLTLGSLIPSILCTALFGENFSVPKTIGFAMIVLATFILASNSKGKAKSGFFGIILLALAAIGDGMIGFAQQLYKQYYTESGILAVTYYPKSVYHFYTYVFAASLLLLLLIGYRILAFKKTEAAQAENEEKQSHIAILHRALLHIIIAAVCMFAANYLQTVATNDYGLSSQMLYPITKGGCLITVNFTAMLFFGEKITPRSVLGSLVALGGIVAMSIL